MLDYISNEYLVYKMTNQEFDTKGSVLLESDKSELKPKFTLKKVDEGVVIKFSHNETGTIKLFCKRSSEEAFSFIANVSGLTYIDERPNLNRVPELREYKALYHKGTGEWGQVSDTVLIIKK